MPLPDDIRILSVEIPPWDSLSGDSHESNTRWHQIALTGEWDGHWQGAMSIKERDIDQMVQHQRAKGIDTLVDYEHNSMGGFFALPDGRAAGWINAIEKREVPGGGFGAFARVRWNPPAAESIRNGEFRYLSPVIRWATKDRKTGVDTGVSLPSVALTNTPFLEELPEVQLNSALARFSRPMVSAGKDGPMPPSKPKDNTLDTILSALGVDSDAAEGAIRGLQSAGTALFNIREDLGLDQAADEMAVRASISALRERADRLADPTELADLRAKVAELRCSADMDRARAAGKITAENEGFVRQLAMDQPELFAQWERTAPAVVPVSPVQRANRASGNGARSGQPQEDEVKQYIAQLTDADWDKINSGGYSAERYVKSNIDYFRAQ